jgi:multiple sugar transport system substrate-binding protein
MPSIVKKDPWWLDPKDPHRVAYTTQVVLGPTLPQLWVYNPAWAQIESEHVWQEAWADIMKNDVAPADAMAKASKRVEEVFAKYPIA